MAIVSFKAKYPRFLMPSSQLLNEIKKIHEAELRPRLRQCVGSSVEPRPNLIFR